MNEDKSVAKSVAIGINEEMAKEIMSSGIYESDASALREQFTNALSHGCTAYHEKYGYTNDVYVDITIDHGERTVTIRDNGMGMDKHTFQTVFMFFGNSTVSKKDNNKRSGMFGLGAISFFRIASSCIVESFHRESGEHFTFMTRGTKITEVLDGNKEMLGGEHNPDKGIIGDYGTSTKIYLKENVRINQLVNMVKIVGSNYPVRTLLHVINSEGEQSIQNYQKHDQDEEVELPAIATFEDFVKKECGITATETPYKYTKILDDEHVEVYITSKPLNRRGEECDSYLCRVPMKIELKKFNDYKFVTYVNIKQEKYQGINDEGEEELLAIPMRNRDRAEQRADEWLDYHLVDKVIPVIQQDNHFTSVKQFRNIPNHWTHNRYNMESVYDEKTMAFVNSIKRISVRRRNIENGLSKPRDEFSLWELIKKHEYIFYHPTCHLDSFLSVLGHLSTKDIERTDVCVVGETVKQRRRLPSGEPEHQQGFANHGKKLVNKNYPKHDILVHDFTGLDIIDIKEFKKKNKIKIAKSDRPTYDSGAKVWLADSYGTSLSLTEAELERYEIPLENVYYAGDIISYSDIRNSRMVRLRGGGHYDGSDKKTMITGKWRKKIGLIVAKKYPKSIPNISEMFDEVEELIKDGEVFIWNLESNEKQMLKGDWWIEPSDDKISWNQWNYSDEDFPEDDPVTRTYNKFNLFDSEKFVTLTLNNSAFLKRAFKERTHAYDGPDHLNYMTTNTSGRKGIMFCPSKFVEKVALYFAQKHNQTIENTEINTHQMKELKSFPIWSTASDEEWNNFYEEKKWQATIREELSVKYLKYDTVQKMIQCAKDGDTVKFGKIKWKPKEIEEFKEEYTNAGDVPDAQMKRAKEQCLDLLLRLHPNERIYHTILKCDVKNEDCVVFNNTTYGDEIRSKRTIYAIEDKENLEKIFKKDSLDFQLFVKLKTFRKKAYRAREDETGNGNIQINVERYPTFDTVTLDDENNVVIDYKQHINDSIDTSYLYYNNEFYKKYDEWDWNH